MRRIGRSSSASSTPLSTADAPLDTVGLTGAFAAYSLRKLRSAYSGNCVRIRRSNDNAEADIGFSSGWIDKTAVDTHCTTNDGYVVTWYDQSGNGYNLTQATTTLQFKIWHGASRDWQGTIDNRPVTMPLANNGYYLLADTVPSTTTAMSLGVICGFKGASAPTSNLRAIYGDGGTLGGFYFPNKGYDPEVVDSTGNPTDFVTGVTPAANTSYICGWAATGSSTTRVRFKGVTYSATGISYNTNASNGYLLIGGNTRFASAFHTFQEAIWWTRDIGEHGLTLYAGNCLSSSWYGGTSYV